MSFAFAPKDTQPISGAVSVSNFPAVQPVSDNSGSLTVDGTVNVGNLPAVQPVSDNSGSLTVDGTVNVGNLPAVQPVSDNSGSLTVDGAVNVSNLPATYPVTDNSGSLTVDGAVSVSNFPATYPVTDNGGSLTVDGTINVNGAVFTHGHLSTINVPFGFEIAHTGTYTEDGIAKAAYVYRTLGRRVGFNSTSVQQDVAEFISGDLLPSLTGAENLELVSSSAQDDASPGTGTGTHTVRITYLNTSYVLTYVDYALNGTAAVAVAEKMLFIYNLQALTGHATTEVGAGNIDLRIAGGGAVHERIVLGGNRSKSCRFMVPDGYKAYIFNWTGFAIGGTMDLRLRATVTTLLRALNGRFVSQDVSYLAASQNFTADLVFRLCPARSVIKNTVIPGGTANTNRVDTSFSVLLVQD